MRFECGRLQRLHQPALRVGFGAHAALFAHHVALFIELAEYRLGEALGFQQEPELDAVGGEAVEILGGIDAGFRVHAHAAVFVDDLGNCVGDHVGIGFVDGRFQVGFQSA